MGPEPRPVRPLRRHALRAGGTGAVGQGRHAARRDRGAARREQPGARVRADGLRPAASARRPGAARIGGVLAANLSGPRRIKAGAARDHFLGFTAVSGRGETFKSGGRVVKNVTGYDLCKLLAGSWGTLAAMTDVTVKVLPRAETEQTLLVLGLDDAAAAQAMSARDGLAERCLGRGASAGAASPATRARRQAGRRRHRAAARRRRALGRASPARARSAARSRSARSRCSRRRLRARSGGRSATCMPFAGATDRALWRISTAPTRGHEVARRDRRRRGASLLRLGRRADLGRAAAPSDDGGAARRSRARSRRPAAMRR